MSIDGGEEGKGGDSSLLYSAGCWLRSCASSLGPTAGGDGFGPEVGRGERGVEERNKPSSLQSLVGLVEERRGEGGFCTLRWV